MLYDCLKNPKDEILKLAQYLNTPCADDLAEKIADRCSFHNLKNVVKIQPYDFTTIVKEHMAEFGNDEELSYPVIFRKGIDI